MTEPNWKKIMMEFIKGEKLKDLSIEYKISLETIKSRHRMGNWSKHRADYKRKLNENLTNNLAEKTSFQMVDAIKAIDEVVNHLMEDLKTMEPTSKEGIAKCINELLRTRGIYTGETVKKQEVKHGDLTFGQAVAKILSRRQKGEPAEKP